MDSELQASRCADSCQMSPRSPVLGQDGLAEWDASGSGALRDEETIMSQPSLMPPDAHSREGYPGGQRTSMASYRKSRSKLLLSPAFRTGRPPLTEAGYEEAFAFRAKRLRRVMDQHSRSPVLHAARWRQPEGAL